ncbi:MAG: bifunctional diaminohydroxyphosphoribosylaminopyrimidine deaminase/5-amino-6-(5-phosphoribosylamino)uracil reductase RibD [bacterium]
MRQALDLAAIARGRTHPNPAVGAVVVKGGRVVGRGYHRRCGLPHAEVEAIRDAGRAARGAELYVTLEPCAHHGRTPPCVDAIVAAGLSRVYAAMIDPNPLVNGKGLAALRRSGVGVETGLGAAAAECINESYIKFMRSGRPFVTLKIAQTLDGKIATAGGKAKWITSAASRKLVRRMRSEAQALVVGARTGRLDDPLLLSDPRRKKDYLRCVLDPGLSLPPSGRLVRTADRYPVVIYCAPSGGMSERRFARRRREYESAGVVVAEVRAGRDGLLALDDVLADLSSRLVMHVWVEGGSKVFTSFLRDGLVDKVVGFVAPKIMGDGGSLGAFGDLEVKLPDQCPRFSVDTVGCAEDDLVLTLRPVGAAGKPGRTRGARRGGRFDV